MPTNPLTALRNRERETMELIDGPYRPARSVTASFVIVVCAIVLIAILVAI